jgi:hypothetical protein
MKSMRSLTTGRKGRARSVHNQVTSWRQVLLAGTDLKAHGGEGDWSRAVNEGSRSILIWESQDLIGDGKFVHWSELYPDPGKYRAGMDETRRRSDRV